MRVYQKMRFYARDGGAGRGCLPCAANIGCKDIIAARKSVPLLELGWQRHKSEGVKIIFKT